MPGSPTPRWGLTVPTVGGDANAWGGELNTDLASIDTLLTPASQSFSAPTTLTLTVPITLVKVTAGGGGVAITLPSAATNIGCLVAIKKVDAAAGAVTINAVSGTVELTSITNQNQSLLFMSDGTNWLVVAQL